MWNLFSTFPEEESDKEDFVWKNYLHWTRRVGWNVIVDCFRWKTYVCVHYSDFLCKENSKSRKNFQTEFQKLYSTLLEERFQEKRVFFRKKLWSPINCGLWSEIDSNFRVNFPTKLSQLKITCQLERFNEKPFFWSFHLLYFVFGDVQKKFENLVNVLWQGCQTSFLRVQMNVFNQNNFLRSSSF